MPDTNTTQTTIFKGYNLLGIAKPVSYTHLTLPTIANQAIFKHTVFREGRPPGT